MAEASVRSWLKETDVSPSWMGVNDNKAKLPLVRAG